MARPFVAILIGAGSCSESVDIPMVQLTADVLKKLDVSVEIKVYSAHCTPEATQSYVKDADHRGAAVFIACSGMGAHLAGVVSSLTIKPVIGVPIGEGPLGGLDTLLSTVQMPGGVPVATVSLGKEGAINAGYLAIWLSGYLAIWLSGYLAAQIIALNDKDLANRLRMDRQANAEAVLAKDAVLQQQLNG